jgi:adenylate kinase/phosphoserine phosphatase
MDNQSSQPQASTMTVASDKRTSSEQGRPIVIGIYGLPGSGKTSLLKSLEIELGQEKFSYYEGSQVISSLLPGGLDEFRGLSEADKTRYREAAIDKIRDECAESHKAGVVTGHFMFWSEGGERETVYTPRDFDTYTHIIYLDVNEDEIEKRRRNDTKRERPAVSKAHIRNWQEVEKEELRRLCYEHAILFGVLPDNGGYADKAAEFMREFVDHSQERNLLRVKDRLNHVLGDRHLETMLILDADKTLAAEDATAMFCGDAPLRDFSPHHANPLKRLFSSPLQYSYTAFQQAMLLFEEACDGLPGECPLECACDRMIEKVKIHPEFVALLRLVKEQDHVGAIVVTCGLGLLWERILEAEGLSGTVKVIGNGRIADGPIVTPEIKGGIVNWLQANNLYVVAFGDSPLDMAMLAEADQAVVVVGEKGNRSKTMDRELLNIITGDSRFSVKSDKKLLCQVLLPSHAPPRLNGRVVPIIQLQDPAFLYSILRHCNGPNVESQVIHASERSATKWLVTPTRDARVSGPALRDAHRRIGYYLAVEFLTELLGLEEVKIPHVLGHQDVGHIPRHEKKTCIVALMRGGEPMASGVNNALPHASKYRLKLAEASILLDSVSV